MLILPTLILTLVLTPDSDPHPGNLRYHLGDERTEVVEQWWLKDELLARARQPYDKATVDSVPPKQIPPKQKRKKADADDASAKRGHGDEL